MEYFTADFLQFFYQKASKLVLDGRMGTQHVPKHFRDFLKSLGNP